MNEKTLTRVKPSSYSRGSAAAGPQLFCLPGFRTGFLFRRQNNRFYFTNFDLFFPCARGYNTAMVREMTNERKARAMLRLLGILSLGHLLFGGHRRHRALRRGLLLGALLGYLAGKDFDTDRVAEDVRKKARKARRTAREAVRAAKREIRRAEHDRRAAEIHERIDARKAEREERLETIRAEIEARKARKEETRQEETAVRALPVSGVNEAKEIRELADELDRDARTAAMAADVPTIDFPEEDGKYLSAGKYGYVQ